VSPQGEVPAGQVTRQLGRVIEIAGLDAADDGADLGLDEEQRGTARVAGVAQGGNGPLPGRIEPAKGPALVSHRNAPLSPEGRRRLVERCQHRPVAHVAAEMGISRACASKWVNRWRRYGDLGLLDRSSTPHHSPRATTPEVIVQIETWRREKKWSASRITHELADQGLRMNRRTVTRHLTRPPPVPRPDRGVQNS